VLVDRNCHKSILHSIIMTGAIPLYLCPERNELGIIGPIPLSEFSKESIQAKIDASPLARGRAPKVKLAVVTNSTYDELCYNAEMVKQALGIRSKYCTSTRPGTPTPPFTSSMQAAMAWAPSTTSARHWCSPPIQRTSCWRPSARPR